MDHDGFNFFPLLNTSKRLTTLIFWLYIIYVFLHVYFPNSTTQKPFKQHLVNHCLELLHYLRRWTHCLVRIAGSFEWTSSLVNLVGPPLEWATLTPNSLTSHFKHRLMANIWKQRRSKLLALRASQWIKAPYWIRSLGETHESWDVIANKWSI